MMDLKEYDYICTRPDTYPKCGLQFIKKAMLATGSQNVHYIDRILKEGYLTPPKDYKYHGYYKILLNTEEKHKILESLINAQTILEADKTFSAQDKHNLAGHIRGWTRCINEKPETYEEYLARHTCYDLTDISLEDFQDFLFNHPIPNKDIGEEHWYWDFDLLIDYNEEQIANSYIELFEKADALLNKYSLEQLEQGLWAIPSENLDCSVYNLIWNSSLDLNTKDRLIQSMYHLYEKLFNVQKLETSCDMWWDSLAYSYCVDDLRDPENNETDRVIQDSMFDVLCLILNLSSEGCRYAALHGLGHLRHRNTETAIRNFLDKNKCSDAMIEYAESAIQGDIL